MASSSRREVDDAEFEAAWANPEYRRVMAVVIRAFKVPPEKSTDVMGRALLGFLGYHKAGRGLKASSCLTQYTRWACLNALRAERRRTPEVPFDEDPDEVAAKPRWPAERREDMTHLFECMGKLGPHDRRVLRQRYFEGLTYPEIGESNGYTRFAAADRVAEAEQNLRQLCFN